MLHVAEGLAERLATGLRARGLDLVELAGRMTLAPTGPIRAGVSGGPDSMALVLLARAVGREVVAVHVDHGLRPGSEVEGAAIARTLWPFGIPVLERRVKVAAGPNLEARARQARLEALAGAATAHTLDDQAETILINLLRGTGLRGLAAMEPGPRHPLLALRRRETQAVCEAAGIEPLADPMNGDDRFVRVRVREELLPLANEIARRDVAPLLARTAELARSFEDALDLLLARTPSAWEDLPPVLQRRALAGWIRARSGLRPSASHLEAVLEVARGVRVAHMLPGGLRVERSSSGLRLHGIDGGELGCWPEAPRGGRLESRVRRGRGADGVAG
jgi:tRNA(Ile)-lysidine synthase